jgi:hypothetical protein
MSGFPWWVLCPGALLRRNRCFSKVRSARHVGERLLHLFQLWLMDLLTRTLGKAATRHVYIKIEGFGGAGNRLREGWTERPKRGGSRCRSSAYALCQPCGVARFPAAAGPLSRERLEEAGPSAVHSTGDSHHDRRPPLASANVPPRPLRRKADRSGSIVPAGSKSSLVFSTRAWTRHMIFVEQSAMPPSSRAGFTPAWRTCHAETARGLC